MKKRKKNRLNKILRNGHYCWVCSQHKPNEKFSGKGHKNHICKACSKLPKTQLTQIEGMRELMGYWEQKNISKKNISRIEALSKVSNSEIAELAQVILEVTKIRRYRKKRFNYIFRENKELIPRLEKVGLFTNWRAREAVNHDEESVFFDCEFDEFDEVEYLYESDDPLNFEYHLRNDENN